MMDRNYPTSSFGDPLAPPAQTVAWAYDRGSATIKPSSSYGATQLESELLQRQNYTSSHQMPTYTTPPHPTGLSGVFDSGGNTTEASIMNFLSAMESRSLQAGPASASLLSTFRGPSWPASTNSSTTELYLTGTLPSAATFPAPAALSSYQHVGAFPSRSYAAATSSLGLQDPAFSTSANGLLPHHDPLLHLKASQTVLPAGLAFNHIPAPSLGSPLPIQSSTYRSAQESAPHLLQPQFSLLPQALSSSSQPASQPYGAPVFSGSIERALQRECSVIKHHQRPSSSHAPPEQLPGPQQHSLQGYLGSVSEAEVPFQQQDPSRQTPVPCSPSSAGGADPAASRGVNGTPQPPKGGSASQAALQQSQAYPSSIPSPGYSSPSAGGAKTKDCSSKLAPHPSEAAAGDGHAHPQGHAGASPESYPSPGQKQNSVIASQQSAQLPSLLSISHSQTYITSHSQSQASYSSADSSLYKTLPSFSGQSGSEATGSQSLVYTQSPGQGQEAHYVAQAQALCLGNLSQSYPSSHSQGTPNMSYPSQSQSPASVAKSQSYAVGQSLVSSYTTSSSSTTAARAQSLSTTNSPQGYVLMQPSSVGKADGGLTLPPPQTQKYLLPAPSPAFSSANHAQALQNNVRPSAQDLKPANYGKLKLEELPLQDLQALQQASLDTSGNNMAAHNNNNNVVYVVSKMDDRYNTQSVIRSSSRSDEQQHLLGLGQTHMAQVKEERMGSHSHGQLVSGAGSRLAPETKTANTETQQQNHQALTPRPLVDQNHSQAAQTQFIRLPSAQVLIEPNQMILLQQPLIHPGHNPPSKVLSGHMQQGQGSGPVQVQYLQMDRELISANVNGSHSQQGATVSHQGTVDSKHLLPKDPYAQSTNQQSHDNKHQFTLNSICFPESMLLADERNILSNVDDILAATAAACGVTPQDFVKATSGGADGDELSAMANPADSSKGQFQTVDVRHLSPGFSSSSSQHSIVANADSSHAMALALNGGQMTADGQGRPPPPRPSNGSELHPDDRCGPESDYHLAGQGYDQSGLQHGAQGKTKGTKAIKREDGLMESQSEGFPKKRARAKGPAKGLDEDDGQPRPAKRGAGAGQAKRQNSRGSDASSPSTSDGVYDGYQHQERIRQKLREVEEKQPEVKVGFMGSFLDFLKSGPKQHFNATPARAASRSRKPSSKQAPCPLPPLTHKLQQPPLPAPLLPQEGHVGISQRKRLEEDLQRNLETLPSFSSDEEESVGKNWALQNSISSALSALDEPADRRHRTDTRLPNSVLIPDQAPSMHQALVKAEGQQKDAPKEAEAAAAQERAKEIPPGQLANQLTSVAIEGLTDEELSDSGGEGMYRERDEFVVRNEDIESLQVTLRAGEEPPAIWKVQKALLQKFVPELRDGRRVFSATNSYLGYFGDAKTMYRRVYVKFLDTVNKREYVRVCNRKPRCKPMHSMRGAQVKCLLGLKPAPPSVPCDPATPRPPAKPRPKQPRPRAEPPPKKRRKWKEEFPASPSESSAEEVAEEFNSQVPLSSRFLNTRTMKDTFKSFVELLTSVALDAEVMSALEQENDELLLPHMKRVEGMITDNRKRLVPKLRMGQLFKAALDSFPEISVVTELKKDGETPAFKVRLSGKAYNRKTMKPSKSPSKLPLEYTVDQQKTQWFSLYHSLQHYKYHTYLMCKDEIASLRVQTGDLGQEQTVQLCMQNGAWVEGLFDRFGELLNQVQQACL